MRRDHVVVLGLIVLALIVYAGQSLIRRAGLVNPHDPGVGRIDAFELQPGEVGVVVRVRHGQQPARGVTVWADRDADEDDGAARSRFRLGKTDAGGLVRVPITKGNSGHTRLFARDADGRLGAGTLHGSQLLSAPDIVLVEVAPRAARLLTDAGRPIAGASVTAESFFSLTGGADGASAAIDVPLPVQQQYSVKTDGQGRFAIAGTPAGFDCRLAFRTTDHGQGHVSLPASSNGECRLSLGGMVRLRVSGEGSANDVRDLRCRLTTLDQRAMNELHVDGQRTLRHPGSPLLVIGNIVPGNYRIEIEGTPHNATLPVKSLTVTVAAGQTVEASVPLKRAGQVEGRAVDGRSGQGIGGVRLAVSEAFGGQGYGGSVTTRDDGRFSAYVPDGVPVNVLLERNPKGYASSKPWHTSLLEEGSVAVASGATRALADIKLFTQGPISGVVVAGDRPIPGALVQVEWDVTQRRPAVSLKTDAAGRFTVGNTPPGRPVLIRARSGGMVNAAVSFTPEELAAPLTIPVSAANVVQLRGKVNDLRGQPVARARVVVAGTLLSRLPAAKPDPQAGPVIPAYFGPDELVAVFTDSAGAFESGPLWPGCNYGVTVTCDGMMPRQLPTVEGKPGEVHEMPPTVLRGTMATAAGTVLDTDGKPLAGASVINSGDAPRRVIATSDAAGRFELKGLYEGPTVLVAHKADHRWTYAVARPGEAEPTLVLRSLTDAPAAITPLSDEHRRGEAELMGRLKELAAKGPKPAGRDPKADAARDLDEARKNLEGFLAKHAKQAGRELSQRLVRLARLLAKEDREKALRVLREAATIAKGFDAPPQPGLKATEGMLGTFRTFELVNVAQAAAELGWREPAAGWLNEAEEIAGKLPEMMRRLPELMLAVAWVTIDPARTEKLLASAEAYSRDGVVTGVIDRLLLTDVRQAIPWLDRFARPRDRQCEQARSRVAVHLARSDLAAALRMAEGIDDPVVRGKCWSELAAVVHKADARQAHALIDRAAALVAEAKEREQGSSGRLGLALAVMSQGKVVEHPDVASLVALALSAREPTPPNEEQWRSQTDQLAAGVASVDAAAGRALLGHDRPQVMYFWLVALALADPSAALRHVETLGAAEAGLVLSMIGERSAVIQRLGLSADD